MKIIFSLLVIVTFSVARKMAINLSTRNRLIHCVYFHSFEVETKSSGNNMTPPFLHMIQSVVQKRNYQEQ